MPSFILKFDTPLGPRYLMWSTVVDAPITHGMTRDQFEDWYRRKYGTDGQCELPERMARADAKGTSSRFDDDMMAVVAGNRAGANESALTVEQIVDYYCLRQCEGPCPKGT